MPEQMLPLSEDDVVRMTHRMRKFGGANCWTGTSGTLANDVRLLLQERARLLNELAKRSEDDKSIRVREGIDQRAG